VNLQSTTFLNYELQFSCLLLAQWIFFNLLFKMSAIFVTSSPASGLCLVSR
jgi:hypothetical protein